jgi:hypothetical protein
MEIVCKWRKQGGAVRWRSRSEEKNTPLKRGTPAKRETLLQIPRPACFEEQVYGGNDSNF